MRNARTIQVLLVATVAACALFVQSSFCLAERAGLLPCHEHVAEESGADPRKGAEADCCPVVSTALPAHPVSTAPLSLKEFCYFALKIGAPEAPVEEIDYPPQRLS